MTENTMETGQRGPIDGRTNSVGSFVENISREIQCAEQQLSNLDALVIRLRAMAPAYEKNMALARAEEAYFWLAEYLRSLSTQRAIRKALDDILPQRGDQ